MTKRSGRQKGKRIRVETLREKPKGYDFGIARTVMYVADLEFNRHLSEAHIIGCGYKPTPDGGNWVLKLDLGEDVICSITTFDDRTDTMMVAMFIAFFLKGFERHIRDEVLGNVKPLRHELTIFVTNISHVPDDLKSYFAAHLVDQPCAVTRLTDVDDDTTPTIVSCREDIGDLWNVGEGKGGTLQILFGMVVLEIVYALMRGKIESDTLRPNIVSVVRQTIS